MGAGGGGGRRWVVRGDKVEEGVQGAAGSVAKGRRLTLDLREPPSRPACPPRASLWLMAPGFV